LFGNLSFSASAIGNKRCAAFLKGEKCKNIQAIALQRIVKYVSKQFLFGLP